VSEEQEFQIILQNQIDALENNQFDFLLYNNGAGGEFLSSLISKYSPFYNLPLNGTYDSYGRFILNVYFLSNIFSGGTKYTGTVDVTNLVNLIYQEIDYKGNLINKINNFRSDYLALDLHLNNLGRVLVRAHHIDNRYMNSKNTYFIYPDTEYWHEYRYKLCRLKLHKKNYPENIAKSKFFYSDEQISFTKKIPMSKMFNKGFLEEIFNIQSNDFHKELLIWHNKNLNLLKNNISRVW